MLNKILISIFLLLLNLNSNAQKETILWYFGSHAGLDFNFTPPHILTNSAMTSTASSSSICDPQGNLLFYTDGRTVYNRNHLVMKNGSGLNGGYWNTGTSMSGIIIPKPGNSKQYYIFTPSDYYNPKLFYSIVDMTRDGGLGEVILKNRFLLDSVVGRITAVKHGNNKSIWVVTHK